MRRGGAEGVRQDGNRNFRDSVTPAGNFVSKKSNEKTEPVHAIPGSDTFQTWLLENLDTVPRLDEVIRTQKKGPKRTGDDKDLKKKIADLFREIGDEKRAKRAEEGRDVERAIAELFRALKAEKNAKRAADLEKRIAELLEDNEKSERAAAGADLEKTIAEVFRAIEEFRSGRSVSHATLTRAKELAETWHPELGKSNLLVVLLAGLVVAQKREIESLVKVRQLFTFCQPRQRLKSKQRYDIGRRCVPLVGRIEWEFGGVLPPGESDMNDSAMNCLKPPEPPICLDEILTGGRIDMHGLVSLFGRDRHLLSKLATVPIKNGREISYDYRTVRDIMDALLNEKSRKRKGSMRRRPPKEPWLSDRPLTPWRPVNHFWSVRHYCRSLRGNVREPLRTRVLTGMELRINSLSERVPKDIKSVFLAVIHHHLSDSGKK
jgi:hypothetical protein